MIASNKHIITKVLPVSMFFITIYSVIMYSNYIDLDSIFRSTAIWWAISIFILSLLLISALYFFDRINNKNMIFIILYIAWNIISIIRGAFVAEIYWDWKALIGNTMVLLLPIASYATSNITLSQSLLSYYLRNVLPLFVIFAFIINTDAYGFYLMPISFLLLFIPILTTRQKFLILGIFFIIIFSDTAARSNVLKFTVPILLLSFYYLRKIISTKVFEVIRITIIIIPIILFVLGATGLFNVFKIQNYISADIKVTGNDWDGERKEVSMIEDTRTFLYEEVTESAITNNYWLFGRTPSRGNDSMTFGLIEFEWTGRYERLTNEIGLANVFTWTGIIGVILYLAIFYHASFLAINRSNNIFAKILGLYVAFRSLYSWIEDYQSFSVNYLMIWLMIGLCMSTSFRMMSNNEVTIWARGIFNPRYTILQSLLYKKSLYEKNKNSYSANMSQQKR